MVQVQKVQYGAQGLEHFWALFFVLSLADLLSETTAVPWSDLATGFAAAAVSAPAVLSTPSAVSVSPAVPAASPLPFPASVPEVGASVAARPWRASRPGHRPAHSATSPSPVLNRRQD